MQILSQKTFLLMFKKIETVQYKVNFVITGTKKKHSIIDFTKSLTWNLQQTGDGPVSSIFFTKLHKDSYHIKLKICLNAVSEGVYLTRSKTQNKTKFFTYMVPNKLSIRLKK